MITIYSKPNCSYCENAAEYLSALNIAYEEIDITSSKEAYAFFKEQGHTTTPQLYKDGRLFVQGGYAGLVTQDVDNIKERSQ